jgi:protein AroM
LIAKRMGMITIGQSPRTDLVPEIQEILGPEVEVMEAGALDGLSHEEVKRFYPRKGDIVLCTRMADGTEVVVGRRHIIPRVQHCVNVLTERGAEVLLFLCTGRFPEFSTEKLFIEPQKIVDHMMAALLSGKERVGMLVPLASQTEQARKKYGRLKGEVIIRAASPYGRPEELRTAGRELKAADPSLIVMHCMGYSEAMRRTLREITGKPIVLARSLVARVVKELLS